MKPRIYKRRMFWVVEFCWFHKPHELKCFSWAHAVESLAELYEKEMVA